MSEEIKQNLDKPSEPSFLEQVKAEREALEKVRADNERFLNELKELKAQEMLSGKTTAGTQVEIPKEETAKDYIDKIKKEHNIIG